MRSNSFSRVLTHQRLGLETPGGGGYGAAGSADDDDQIYGAYNKSEPSARASGSLAHRKEIAEGN